MKKYKQVLAALLAMNLTVYVMPTGTVKISAGVEGQSNEDTTNRIQEENTEAAVAAEEATTVETEISDSEDETGDSSDMTDTVDIADEDIDDSADIADVEMSGESDGNVSEEAETLFSDGSSADNVKLTDGLKSETAIQVSGSKLSVSQFKNYDPQTDKIDVDSAAQLILLSNCDPKELQKITINIKNSGQWDITGKTKITAADITKYLKSADSAAADEESQQESTVSEDSDNEDVSNQNISSDIENIQKNTDQEISAVQGNSEAEEKNVADIQDSVENATEESQKSDSVEESDQVVAVQETADLDYTYQSLGNAQYPFQGTISGEKPSYLKIDHSFFGVLSSEAKISMNENKILEFTWCGDGTEAMAASVYQFDSAPDGGEHTLPFKMLGDSSGTMGCLIGTVQSSGDITNQILKIKSDTVVYNDKVSAESTKENIGLICGTLKSGTICLEGYTLPASKYSIKSTATESAAGNAGGLIGVMETGTVLDIKSAITVKAEVTSDNGNAGGLVGLMGKNATIITENSVIVDSPEITGAVAAGGVAGTAEDAIFDENNLKAEITVNEPSLTGKNSKSNVGVGGFIGKYTLNNSEDTENVHELPSTVVVNDPKVLIYGTQEDDGGNAGGYFGLLELNGITKYTIASRGSANKNFSVDYKDDEKTGGSAWSYGSLIGRLTTTDTRSTLLIKDIYVTSGFPIYAKTKDARPRYHGGLIGYVGGGSVPAYVEVRNVNITVSNPHACFGGVTGCLADKNILKAKDVTLTTQYNQQDQKIWEGGGILGEAHTGSVLELSGLTDLTNASYDTGDKKAGQLVGVNNNALIYARGDGNGNGWKYKRSTFKNSKSDTYNDLLCYGQVIRLKENSDSATGLSQDLINIDSYDHTVTLKKLNGWTATAVTLSSADDFALLSIAWTSRGNFGKESGITTQNWSNIKNSTITISGNIDLTGTGITGLSRDTKNSEDDIFSGTLQGNEESTLTLSIGEVFGFQNDKRVEPKAEGCGKVYAIDNYHASLGIFSETNNATIKNLILNGGINLSNKFHAITAGGIAGYTSGSAIIDKVTAGESITANGPASQTLLVGGLYGEISTGTLTLQNETTITPKITLESVGANGSWVCAGGALGKSANDGFKLQVNGVTVGNKETKKSDYSFIKTDASNYAYTGGLVGLISKATEDEQNDKKRKNGTERNTVEITNLTFDGFNVEASKATEVSGSLLGSVWQNTEVSFKGNDSSTALTVKNSSVKAPKANGAGGLAYRSSGMWEIGDYGIDIQSLDIQSKSDVGLLVCRGEKGKIKINSKDTDTVTGALYLNTTAYWDTAYKLAADNTISVTAGGVFDEFVAHTAETANKITDIRNNGVISIATAPSGTGRVGVEESGANCTTYQNRTSYGKSRINGCSRYYYDLDQCLKEVSESSKKKDGWINTPQELLLWSVYNYAGENIQDYITKKKQGNTNTVIYEATDSFTRKNDRWYIQNDSGQLELNMKKYSYYPVTIADSSINLYNATIRFYNKEIETAENENKSTQGTVSVHSQHYTMHCGVLFNYQAPSATLTVNNVIFSGSIGKVNKSTSGVLIANKAAGYLSGNIPRYVRVRVLSTEFNGLTVNECGNGYAPLLLGSVGNYTTVDVNDIKTTEYTLGTAVASSLIGRVGDKDGKQINLTFKKILLPDKKANGTEGIFSHATLLESFTHDGTSSGATYTFNRDEEWTNDTYNHGVTYGREITESNEYANQQKWYYDEAGNGIEDAYDYFVHTEKGQKDFSAKDYLPYVCEENKYVNGGYNHEIKVNQRMDNIVNGCGTYGHPYIIKSGREMQILSNYMSTGRAPQDWCVTITGDQSKNHAVEGDYSTDVTYKYKGSETGWVQVKKTDGTSENWLPVDQKTPLDNEVMQQYLLNAYYDLEGTEKDGKNILELSDFGGFGTQFYPFRGVVTSKNGTTVELSGSAPSNGLIGYSNGCVVKNLVISYEKCSGKNLTVSSSSMYYSGTVFGGVIGGVLGGDNIIDSVTVVLKENWLTLSGEKKYLIPIGGYVGEISGGGVIFRNMAGKSGLSTNNFTAESGITDITGDSGNAYKNLYINPYIGRVLDGFAFYEIPEKTGTQADSLNNSDKNYQINTLVSGSGTDSDVGCVTVQGDTVTANNAKGLLLLSAIVNSGAASGGTSNAYSIKENTENKKVNDVEYKFGGKYGKVRNAAYSNVGATNDNDFAISIKDDRTGIGMGSLPYLVTKYCNGADMVFNLSGNNSNAKIALKKESEQESSTQEDTLYDLTEFGSGYQGIGARYVSNAVLDGDADYQRNSENPKGIEPELISFEGNGRTIWINTSVKEYVDDSFCAASVGGVFNLLRVGKNSCKINNLTVKGKNDSAEVALKYYSSTGVETPKSASNVDVGGFAGTVSKLSMVNNVNVIFDTVTVSTLKISAPRNAGGLLGSSIIGQTNELKVEERLIYDKEKISSGDAGVQLKNTTHTNLNIKALISAGGFVGFIKSNQTSSLVTTKTNLVVGEDSAIESTFDVITAKGKSDTKDTATGAGGVFGYVQSNVNINTGGTESYQKAVMKNVSATANMYAGGFIGKIDGKNYNINLASCEATADKKGEACISTEVAIDTQSGNTDERREGAGGIVGYAKGNGNNKITNCDLKNMQINAVETATKALNQDHEGAGGIVGLITDGSSVDIEKCNVTGSDIYGAVAGGIAGITKVTTTFKECRVSGTSKTEMSKIKARCTASGILGYWFSSGNGTIQNCYVQYLDIAGQHWGVGALIGDGDKAGGALYVFDASVQDSNVTAKGGSWYQGGGIIGDLRCDLTAANLLFSDVKIEVDAENNKGGGKKGLLIAKVDATGKKKIYIAGVSIQKIAESNKNYALVGYPNDSTGYIAFTDYMGSALEPGKQGKDNLLDTEGAEPYVVTSPESKLRVYESAGAATAKYIYGDGAYWGSTTDDMVAKTIWNERNNKKGDHYTYSDTGVEEFNATSVFSTYNTNQTVKATTDFPVFQLGGGDADKVKDYLNILTNGGFDKANNLNTKDIQYVTAKAEVYEYQTDASGKNGKFVKAVNDDGTAVSKAFKVTTNAAGKISFSTTSDYDNDKNRFTLLTVTFTEKDADNKEHKYNVQVLVLVRRMLEMDFSAKLSYGTNFRGSDYKTLTSHVLESFGSSITGYLKYTYNSKRDEFSDYGWQSYIDVGGNVADPIKKELWFDQGKGSQLPAGTQLTLVDRQSGKVYYYETTGKEADNKIPFKNFVSSDNVAYEEPSIAELIQAKASEDQNGLFIKVNEDGSPTGTEKTEGKTYSLPTVQIKNAKGEKEYYRLALDGETGTRYKIEVDTSKLVSGKKSSITEEYYLVITVPKNSKSAALNGALRTEITENIPHQIYERTTNPDDPTGPEIDDILSNTPSTYIISRGYTQSLTEENITLPSKKMNAASVAGSTMKIDVVDAITFPNGQSYLETDELYQRFVGGLQKTVDGTTSSEQFPSGTTGIANFYVYKKEGTKKIYYKYQSDGSWDLIENEETVAASYRWTSDGGNMEVPLADGNINNVISLQGVRDLVRKKGDGESTFYVELKMDASIPTAGLDVIPESDDTTGAPTDYAKLVYTSQLSTVSESLAYSTNRAVAPGTVTLYYRDVPSGAKLTYEADQIGQLGINLLDLQYLDTSREHSLIDTTAMYDLSAMKNLEDALKNSSGIRFTLSLLPKNTTTAPEAYQESVKNADQYLDVKQANSGVIPYNTATGSWSWIVPKGTYWEDNDIKTSAIFDGSVLIQAIQLQVRVDNVESGHFYSNYRVVLTAEILESDGQTAVTNSTQSDNIIYTLAKINPEFVDPKSN